MCETGWTELNLKIQENALWEICARFKKHMGMLSEFKKKGTEDFVWVVHLDEKKEKSSYVLYPDKEEMCEDLTREFRDPKEWRENWQVSVTETSVPMLRSRKKGFYYIFPTLELRESFLKEGEEEILERINLKK